MAIRAKKISKQNIKRFLVAAVLLSGLIIPLACSDNNSNPTQPSAPGGSVASTSTPTGTITPGTPTKTPTLALGAVTPTFTPMFSLPVPVYRNNYQTTGGPRCMVLNGGILTIAENDSFPTGIVSAMEEYTGAGTAVLDLYNVSGGYPNVRNIVLTGCPPIPTPGNTPVPFLPVTVSLHQVQGFANPGGNGANAWSAILDLTGGGGAILYTGYNESWNNPAAGVNEDFDFMPFNGTSYSGVPLNNPQGICADFAGHGGSVYVADTGRGYVDQFSPYEGICPVVAVPINQWNGSQGVLVGGTGSVFKSAAVSFRSPSAVTCDTLGNVWVGDNGYPESYIQEYTSGATTILQSWQGIAGCQVHGLAVDSGSGNVYVADTGNNLVEVYSPTGTLLTAFGDPAPAASEPHPFSPTCIAFSGGFIYVGDANNRFIDVFQ